MTPNDGVALAPFALLLVGAGVVAIFERAVPADERVARQFAAATAMAAGAVAAIAGAGDDALSGALHRDAVATYGTVLLTLATAAAFILDAAEPNARLAREGPRVVLMLVACAGGVLLAAAGSFLVLIVALELVVLSLLALIIRATPTASSLAASRSFFLAGGTASALVAAGIGIVWSVTGSFAIAALGNASSSGAGVGTALIFVGLACVAALVPMHLWLAPSVAALPSPVALFVAVVPRVGALAALLRCAAAVTASDAAVDWRASLAVLAAATLVVGSIAGLGESSLRRLVAYLSIAYFGQLAVAAVTASVAVAFATAAYVPLVVGAFAAIAALPATDPTVRDLRGLARHRPLLTFALAVSLFGLAGLPPTIGFFARLAIFESAVGAQLAWLMFVAALASVVSAAAAARVVFATLDEGGVAAGRAREATTLAVLAAVIAILGGILPGPLLELAQGVRF